MELKQQQKNQTLSLFSLNFANFILSLFLEF